MAIQSHAYTEKAECLIEIILQMVQAASFSHARTFQKQILDVIQIGLEVVEVAASVHFFRTLVLKK